MSDQKKVAKDAIVATATVGAGATFGPAAGLVVRLADIVLASVAERAESSRAQRASQFVEQFMESASPTASARALVAAEIARAPDEVKDAVVAALRQVDDAVSNEVIPALAVVARECVRSGLRKDRFVVGLLRVLRDLEDGEYAVLHHLVTEVSQAISKGVGEWAVLEKVEEPGGQYLRLHPGFELPWDNRFDSLLAMLQREGLFTTSSGYGEFVQGGWRFECNTWKRLASFFPPQPRK